MLNTVAISIIRGYQLIRPAYEQLLISVFGSVSECKQTPTCSEYTIQAIKRHGTITGVTLGVKRIIACR